MYRQNEGFYCSVGFPPQQPFPPQGGQSAPGQTAADAVAQAQEYRRLLKDELKYTIQLKRMKQGKEEIDMTQLQSVRTETRQISEEVRRKMEDRRKRNKLSARKCRENKKAKEIGIKSKLRDLEQENARLNQLVSYYQLVLADQRRDSMGRHLLSQQQHQLQHCQHPVPGGMLTGTTLCQQCHRPRQPQSSGSNSSNRSTSSSDTSSGLLTAYPLFSSC